MEIELHGLRDIRVCMDSNILAERILITVYVYVSGSAEERSLLEQSHGQSRSLGDDDNDDDGDDDDDEAEEIAARLAESKRTVEHHLDGSGCKIRFLPQLQFQ